LRSVKEIIVKGTNPIYIISHFLIIMFNILMLIEHISNESERPTCQNKVSFSTLGPSEKLTTHELFVAHSKLVDSTKSSTYL
jgi:hypothetical protein